MLRRLALLLAIVLLPALFRTAFAHDEGDIVITGVWARPTVGEAAREMRGHSMMSGTPGAADSTPMPMASTVPSAAYLRIENRGGHPIALVGAASPVAMMVELHQTTITNNVASMGEVEGGIVIAAGESVALEPGGYHLMLMDLMMDLAPGDAIALDLTFEMRETDAEAQTVTVAAVVTDLPPLTEPFVLTNAQLVTADDEHLPEALEGVTLPEGLLAFATLQNVSTADAPLAAARFFEEAAPLYVLLDGALNEIDEYDVGVGETVEIAVGLGDIAVEDVMTGALPFSIVLSDDTVQAFAAPLHGMTMEMGAH